MSKIQVKGKDILVINTGGDDFISLTSMAASFPDGSALISKWISSKNTLEYIGLFENLHNPDFNYPEFGVIKDSAGVNRFTMSVGQWIERTGAKGLQVKSGKYGGTYAHRDIAFHFAMWLSPEFQLLVVKEYQSLKEKEAERLGWDYRRFLAKVNYRYHTDAVKQVIIPSQKNLSPEEEGYVYAQEAEMLNVSVFGITSREWRSANPDQVLKGFNIRDLANIHELTVLANLESYHAILIKEGLGAKERLKRLKAEAVSQLKSLSEGKYTYPIDSPHKVYEQDSTYVTTSAQNPITPKTSKGVSKKKKK